MPTGDGIRDLYFQSIRVFCDHWESKFRFVQFYFFAVFKGFKVNIINRKYTIVHVFIYNCANICTIKVNNTNYVGDLVQLH
jgi:hypothetical protein